MTRPILSERLGRIGVWAGFLGELPIARAREVARTIEDLGYGALWIPEPMSGREALTHAAVLLGATERITVVTGIANLWARDPIAAANGGRVLAEASGGRFVLGIGVSHAPLVEGRGHVYRSPLEATRQYVGDVRRAEYTSPGGLVPPLLLGALGPQMLAIARGLCDGVHPYLVPVAHTAMARGLLGPDLVIAPEQAVVLDPDPRRARELAHRHVAGPLALDNYRRNMLRLGFTDVDVDGPSDHLVEALVAFPTVEAVAARIYEHLEHGADHVALQPVVDGGDRLPILRELAAGLDL